MILKVFSALYIMYNFFYPVETNNAGPGNLEVTVNSGKVPTSAQAQGNNEYAISFNPKEPRPHVVELRFNGENVPGSPFTCEVVDVSRVTLAGTGLEKVPVDKTASFTVDAQASVDQLGVMILSPTRQPIPSKIVQYPDGKLEVLYTPREVGTLNVLKWCNNCKRKIINRKLICSRYYPFYLAHFALIKKYL